MQDRAHRRLLDVGHVGVPDRFAVAEAADRRAVDLDVGDDVQLGMLGEERLAVGIRSGRIELAEMTGEGDELGVGEPLPAEAQHRVLEPRRPDRSKRRFAERL